MNEDIFVCMNFRLFTKKGNFAWIKIHVLRIIGSLGYYKSNFHGVHITRKYEERNFFLHSQHCSLISMLGTSLIIPKPHFQKRVTGDKRA